MSEPSGRRASPRVGSAAGFAAAALIGALALRRPELVAVAAPFALLPLVAAHGMRSGLPAATATLDGEAQALESETCVVRVELAASVSGVVDVGLEVPPGLRVAGDNPVTLLARDGGRTVEFELTCDRWGVYPIGGGVARAWDDLGLISAERRIGSEIALKVFPRPEHLREIARPVATQAVSGNHVSRAKAEGVEFADIRAAMPGDALRRVNWRASARKRMLMVNEHHPERSTDVVLFLDTFSEARRAGLTTLDLAVRAAASVATFLLRRKDRVGLLAFGGILRWLLPGSGLRHAYRVVDSLLDAEIIPSFAWKDIHVIPPGVLPPRAMIFALSPLLDERTVACLLDVRGRGFDVVVVEVSPEPFTPATRAPRRRFGPGGDAARRAEETSSLLARRLWVMQRDAVRARYRREGVPVVSWQEPEPLATALEEVRAFRRLARAVRV